jgi:hypothetical protein
MRMKNRFINHRGNFFFILAIIAGISSCTSTAQKKVDARFPRQEQALVVPGGNFGIMVEIIDGEKISTTTAYLIGANPGLGPGKHRLGFYFMKSGTASRPTGTQTTTLYSSGNMSITSTKTTSETYATYEKASELLFIEEDFKTGHMYCIGHTSALEPVVFDAGYNAWYWDWRKNSIKADEASVAIDDEHWEFGPLAWPYVVVIDGEPALFLSRGEKRDIVLTKGRHTFSIIDKKNPRNETITAETEVDIIDDEAAIEIQGAKEVFAIVTVDAADVRKERREAEKEESAEQRTQTKKGKAISSKYPEIFDSAVGPGESIVELNVKTSFALRTQEFSIDGEPMMLLSGKRARMRFKIPNGAHTLSIAKGGYSYYNGKSTDFTAESNLIIITIKQGLMMTDFDVERKSLN